MGDVLAIPLHLAVHVSGFGVAAGLAAYAALRRDEVGGGWLAIVVGAGLLAAASLVQGAELAVGMAWPMYLRAAGYAGIAFGIAGRGSAAAAVAPVLPAGSHVIAAVTGALAAVATIGGTLGRGRQVLLLTAGIALLAAGDLLAPTRPTIGAAVSLVGAVAGLAWLADRSRQSLAARFVTLFGAVLLAVVLVLASVSAAVFDRDLRRDRLDLLAQQATVQAEQIAVQAPATLASALQVFESAGGLPTQLLAGRTTDDTAADAAGIVTAADALLLLDADGRVVGSFDRSTGASLGPAATTLAGLDMVTAARRQLAPADGLVPIELFDTEFDSPELLAIAAHPLFPRRDGVQRRDVLAGVIVAATRTTRRDRLDDIAAQTGAQVAVLVGDTLAGTTAGQDDDLDADLRALAGTSDGQVVTLAGRASFVQVAPIGTDGTPIASLVLFEDATVIADLQRVVGRSLFLAAIVGGLLATLLAGLVTRRATRPVRDLTNAAERIADGDLGVSVATTRSDEVGRLASSFGNMATSLLAREQDLRASAQREGTLRERLESVTASMDEALLAVDGDGTVTMANPAAERLLATAPEDLVGHRLDQVLAGTTEDDDDLARALGDPGHDEVRTVHGVLAVDARTRRAVAATAAPLLTDDGTPGRVMVLRDVTSEAEVERMKTEFVSNAAHELRTPLTPVIGYADLLRRHPDMDRGKRNRIVGEIASSADRLRAVVDKLVNFADLEAGRAHLDPGPVDLSDLVDQTLGDWRERFPQRSFRRRLARDLPEVLVDRRYCRMVLDELLDNAVKFSDGPVVITAAEDDDGRIRIEVRDRGVGIPDEAMAEVRSDFRQADGSATRHYGGLGLGLAIVERILSRMDSDLELTSRMGQWTHVAVIVPQAP